MLNEDKATRYQRLKRRSSVLGSAVQVVSLALLLISGGSILLRDAAMALTGRHFIPAVAIYVVMLAVLLDLIQLPWAFYAGVTLERRYGLSTETTAKWWMNHLKAAAIGLVFSIGAALIVLSLVKWSPDRWWVSAAITLDRKSTRLNSSHLGISYAVFCLKKKSSRPLPAASAQRTTRMRGAPSH